MSVFKCQVQLLVRMDRKGRSHLLVRIETSELLWKMVWRFPYKPATGLLYEQGSMELGRCIKDMNSLSERALLHHASTSTPVLNYGINHVSAIRWRKKRCDVHDGKLFSYEKNQILSLCSKMVGTRG